MRPDYVDFHTHLDLYPDLSAAIAACDRRRTATLTVTTTPKAFARNCELSQTSEFVRVGLGLHPQLVAERSKEISLFEKLLPGTRYVGEIGLDAGPHHYRSLELQKSIFERILRLCADEGGKILSIHSVRATKPVLDMLEMHFPSHRGTAVLHWFSGSASEARRGVALGCYFSVNERMLASPNARRIVREIPENRILTETDGPFVKRDGKPIPAGDVTQAVKEIAALRGLGASVIQSLIVENLRNLTICHTRNS
ncbi:MAG: TatD family hydrolase [Rhodospirillaceae bacterium]|nr:TatD family hydrolase [Rhodospirillaceae bacterium]